MTDHENKMPNMKYAPTEFWFIKENKINMYNFFLINCLKVKIKIIK